MSAHSNMTKLLRELEREGYSATRTNGGHLKIRHSQMTGSVFCPSTPSDHRGMKNLVAILKRKLRTANDQ